MPLNAKETAQIRQFYDDFVTLYLVKFSAKSAEIEWESTLTSLYCLYLCSQLQQHQENDAMKKLLSEAFILTQKNTTYSEKLHESFFQLSQSINTITSAFPNYVAILEYLILYSADSSSAPRISSKISASSSFYQKLSPEQKTQLTHITPLMQINFADIFVHEKISITLNAIAEFLFNIEISEVSTAKTKLNLVWLAQFFVELGLDNQKNSLTNSAHQKFWLYQQIPLILEHLSKKLQEYSDVEMATQATSSFILRQYAEHLAHYSPTPLLSSSITAISPPIHTPWPPSRKPIAAPYTKANILQKIGTVCSQSRGNNSPKNGNIESYKPFTGNKNTFKY